MEAEDGACVAVKNEMHIVSAGKSGAGKSTVARNIFGLEMEMTLSPDAITTECTTVQAPEKHGLTIHITDTVGLSQTKKKKEELRKLYKHTKNRPKVDLLIYCLSINQSSKFVEDGNPAIMKSLQSAYGKEIWEHCVLIFTFSNHIWEWLETHAEENTRVEKYKEFIALYANKFKRELENLKVKPVNVKAIFDLELDPTPEGHTTIAAIPAGDKAEDRVLPNFEEKRIRIRDGDNRSREIDIHDWRDVVFIEIVKQCNSGLQQSLLRYRYHSDAIEILEGVAGGMAGGAALGAGIGAIIGSATGPVAPIAVPITAAVGAAVGAVVVGAVGAGTGAWVGAKTTQQD